eukprot:TRINITY_DN3761_c0_g1_i1.p2 TRINITY_DN3761_c0_g1~~TRINITY_DN3761_c0_g1_i1.p2  ORF type:complete len:137 (+),score=10.26 TRINITY_DN3761_c0_g1_i1:800-1210(+)
MNVYRYFLFCLTQRYGRITRRLFASLFGTHINTAALLYILSAEHDASIKPLYVLMFLYWINNYPTEDVCADYWDVDVKTWRKYVWAVIAALFLKLDTIDLDNREMDALFAAVLDATVCRVQRPPALQYIHYTILHL